MSGTDVTSGGIRRADRAVHAGKAQHSQQVGWLFGRNGRDWQSGQQHDGHGSNAGRISSPEQSASLRFPVLMLGLPRPGRVRLAAVVFRQDGGQRQPDRARPLGEVQRENLMRVLRALRRTSRLSDVRDAALDSFEFRFPIT
eukprot:2360618-Rhodomonas_salina.1